MGRRRGEENIHRSNDLDASRNRKAVGKLKDGQGNTKRKPRRGAAGRRRGEREVTDEGRGKFAFLSLSLIPSLDLCSENSQDGALAEVQKEKNSILNR